MRVWVVAWLALGALLFLFCSIDNWKYRRRMRERCTRVHVDPNSQHLLDIIERQAAQIQRLGETRDAAYAQRDENWRRLCEANYRIAQQEEALRKAEPAVTLAINLMFTDAPSTQVMRAVEVAQEAIRAALTPQEGTDE